MASQTLTPKRQRFVNEYLVDLNAKQAAIRAGYSAHTAAVQGSQLLTKPKVQQAVQAAQAARSIAAESTRDYIVAGLRRITGKLDVRDGDAIRAYDVLAKIEGLYLAIDAGASSAPDTSAVKDWTIAKLVDAIAAMKREDEGLLVEASVKLLDEGETDAEQPGEET